MAGNAARGSKKAGLAPRHILLAVANDEKLNQALKGVTNPSGGVLLGIHPKLLAKKRGTKGKSEMILSPTTEKSGRKAIKWGQVRNGISNPRPPSHGHLRCPKQMTMIKKEHQIPPRKMGQRMASP